ncbi:MAG TPA: DivIVA domain-containing protein [Kineosporiaceae bacterium]|nr:DivIVA domain-containing protein [Kineosporiaceae bacterium]
MSDSRFFQEHNADDSVDRLRPDDVRLVRFRVFRFRAGYDQDEVDDFLDLIDTALRSTSTTRHLSARQVRRKKFTKTWMRAGYDIDEVDTFLDRVIDELGQGL